MKPNANDGPYELRVYESSVGKWNVQLDADLTDDTVRHGTRGSKSRALAIRYALKELNRKVRHWRLVLKGGGL